MTRNEEKEIIRKSLIEMLADDEHFLFVLECLERAADLRDPRVIRIMEEWRQKLAEKGVAPNADNTGM